MIWDQLNLLMVSLLLGYSVFRIFRLVAASQIVQKRIQALFVGIGIAVLGIFFMGLFCDGQGSIFNARYMAVTLLPLGWDYPLLSPAFLNAIPFGAGVVICAVLLSMFRYGFLTSWRLGARSLDHQIAVANQAVRIALHSFKNRFLGVQMAMDLTAARLNSLSGEAVDQARVQIDWARETCREALTSLEVLQSQAQLLHVKPDWVSLGQIWEAVKAKWEIRLGKVTLVEECGQEPLWIWGDRELLLAVVENLFQNAMDALAEKAVAGFEPVVTVTLGREYEWAFFRIQDNGPGIPRQNWHRIFQPFFTTKPSKTNWGLGLTYCHRVLKLHRGYINLRSWPERGTIFEVVLRCRDNLDNRAGLKGQNRQNA